MNLRRRAALVLGVLLVAGSMSARELPNLDTFANAKPNNANDAGLSQRARAFIRQGSQVRGESRLGVPTFLWGGVKTEAPAVRVPGTNTGGRAEEVAARAHLLDYASLYNLNAADVAGAEVRNIHNTGQGAVIVKFNQRVNDIEVFREELNVMMTRNYELIAISGYLTSASAPSVKGPNFVLDAKSAAANAFGDLTTSVLPSGKLTAAGSRDGYQYFSISDPKAGLVEPIRMKQVFFHQVTGLEPGYYIEVAAHDWETGALDYYSYVISAVDGAVLFRNNLTADAMQHGKVKSNTATSSAFTYRVWADTTGSFQPYDGPEGNTESPKAVASPDGYQAPFVAPQDVTLANSPFSQNDPWLPPGSTETLGNNVESYVDLDGTAAGANDGYTAGDFRASVTAPGQFLHTFDPTQLPTSTEQRNAAIQQLFFDTNFLHDWYYDSGFDEAAGNAQTSNFSRGGIGNDSMKAEGQDGSGRNNANMSTPADGGRPRMQMYVFDANTTRYLQVNSPAAIAGFKQFGTAAFGPQTFNVTGDLLYPATNQLGCSAFSAGLFTGKIALIDRGTCGFTVKVKNAQDGGAIAVLVANSASAFGSMGGADATITIPSYITTQANGNAIKAQIATPTTVNVTLRRDAGIDRDGTIDNQIIAHEWAHYLSNRLIGNASGLSTTQARGMGEGWSDTSSMILTVRPDDITVPSNANWAGVYSLAGYVTSGNFGTGGPNDGYYYGIRRYPYSTDLTKNPLTYKHIQNGQALPVGPPVAFGADGSNNAEVHNTGEVWANMLWECYASLLRDTTGATPRLTFTAARDRFKRYLVASLKMTPVAPTILEARDAMLAAAYANDNVDYIEFWQAFAKRGAGVGAIGPDRYSTDNVGVTESNVSGAELTFVSASVDDNVNSCDADGILDAGDTGKLTFTLRNAGSVTLTGTTGTVTSMNANVTIANGGSLTFPSSDPAGITTASVNITMAPGTTGIQGIDYSLSFNDPALAVPGPRTHSGVLRGNTNNVPAASATDDVESSHTVWSPVAGALNPTYKWLRQEITGLQHSWLGPDPGVGSDQYLVSPVFTVNGSGSLNLQFDHSWSFEFDAGGNYDGGRVEMSVNGGAYTDIGAPAYNGTLINYSGDVNPLAGQAAFVAASAGTIHTSLTQAVAPGSTVQIRFRVVTDGGGGAAGWNVDNIAFTGVVETPFDVLLADSGCSSATNTVVSAMPNPSTFGTTVTISANVTSLHGSATGGTVTFKDGAATIGSSSVSGGVASMTTSTLAVGTHSITAVYGGTTGYLGSTSPAASVVVSRAATSVVLGSTPNPSGSGVPVTFTATISSTAGAPAGSITFFDGMSSLGTVAISGGMAQLTTSTLSVGTHSITAQYAGNGTFNASTSNTVSQAVNLPVISLASAAIRVVEGTGTIHVTVNRTGTLTSPSSASYATSDGSAVSPADYTSTSGTVNFAMGASTANIDIPLAADDLTPENLKTFNLTLSSPSGATLGTSAAIITILDNDTHIADFNGDGKNDIVLRNPTTGANALWTMNGTNFVSIVNLDSLPNPAYHIVGVADFNGDGKADILWRNHTTGANAIWLMNGAVVQSIVNLPGLANPDYHIGGVGDFNGDGSPDIVWENYVTGALAIWGMTGTTVNGTQNLPAIPPAYKVSGVGDFNYDGKADILVRNDTTGANAVLLMNGLIYSSTLNLPGLAGTNFHFDGVTDFNNDGSADIIIRDYSNGFDYAWIMDGGNVTATVNLPGLPNTQYEINGPR